MEHDNPMELDDSRLPGFSASDLKGCLDSLYGTLLKRITSDPDRGLRCGLDLGTASIVLVVLSGEGQPLALARQEAAVVRDGLVVNFGAARGICEKLRRNVEASLGLKVSRASIAVPPGTSERDTATHRYVCEAAGLEVDQIWEEPQAANLLIGLKDGALADLGGGTTGAAVFEAGKVVRAFDEPTGGHHVSLVIAGHFKISLEEAENFKLNPQNTKQISPVIAPVLSKMGRILRDGFKGLAIPGLFLAGGSSAAPGAGPIIERETSLKVEVAHRPDLVTPLGIALGCEPYQPESL
jgi:ethanolamine utilization protein EutJ